MMRYFITGATGFVGGVLADQLIDEGHDVVVLARDLDKAARLAGRGAEIHQGDVTDKDSMREPMRGADGVFHVAAIYKVGVANPAPLEAANVGGTRNVLELMDELNIPKGVYTSTLAVFSDTKGRMVDESYRYDGPHLSAYDRTKWEAHYRVAQPMIEQGLPLVIVQPGAIYGPGDTSALADTFAQALEGKLPAVPGRVAYCWSHVSDVAEAHRLAMDRGEVGESYIVAGPPATLREAIDLACRIAGRRPPRFEIPPGLLRGVAGLATGLAKLLPPLAGSAEMARVVAGSTYLGDNTKARTELGYSPRSLEDGFAEYIPQLLAERGIGAA